MLSVRNTTEVMIDLETMSSNNDAAVIAIGAVKFCKVDGPLKGKVLPTTAIFDSFYRTVDLESAVGYGLQMSASTVKWWLQQSKEAQQDLLKNNDSLTKALVDFAQWLGPQEGFAGVWGNGADFDNVILRNAYIATAITPPWSHRQNRCYRTLKSFCPHIVLERQGTHHNALDDAKSQASHAIYLLNALGL